MNIYEHFGVEPIINAAGTKTIYCGSLMDDKVTEAIKEASKYSVHLYDLQAAASRLIAEKTHAEAGLVTSGAFSALTLSAAACMCGLDVSKMNRLPDTGGLPNEFIIPWHQISGYDHAIRLAGGKIIPVGLPNHTASPYEVVTITIDDIRAEINNNTVGIVYAPRDNNHPPLDEVISLAKEYKIPVILDAAAQIPPVENLYRFIDMGADLVCISGGKGIRGPQGSGILCGKRDLICSAALQMLDMAVESFPEWNPPGDFIFKEKIKGRPQHGIGRGAKVDKETIIGLLVALENLNEDKFKEKALCLRGYLEKVNDLIKGITGVNTEMTEDYPGAYPMLMVEIDQKELGKSAIEVVTELKRNKIYPREYRLYKGQFYIHSLNMDEEIAKKVGEKLLRILKS